MKKVAAFLILLVLAAAYSAMVRPVPQVTTTESTRPAPRLPFCRYAAAEGEVPRELNPPCRRKVLESD